MNINTQTLKDTLLNFLIPIISIIVSIGLFVFWVYPSISKLPLLKAEVMQKRELEAQLRTKASNLNNLLDFKSVVDENSALIDQVLVSDPNVPILLTQIDSLARESGLAVTKLSYSFGETSGEDADLALYESVTVSLGVAGNYTQIETFLRNLENSGRIIDIISLRYSESVSEEGADVLSASVVLTSPYLEVQSNAVTDDPVNLNVTSEQFIALIDKLKGLRYFDTTVPSTIVDEALEEGPVDESTEAPEDSEAASEEQPSEGEETPTEEPLPDEVLELIGENE
ncbi:MAG: type 4a pilus biogenesis protein PilO [Patescibacteria group bacterium]